MAIKRHGIYHAEVTRTNREMLIAMFNEQQRVKGLVDRTWGTGPLADAIRQDVEVSKARVEIYKLLYSAKRMTIWSEALIESAALQEAVMNRLVQKLIARRTKALLQQWTTGAKTPHEILRVMVTDPERWWIAREIAQAAREQGITVAGNKQLLRSIKQIQALGWVEVRQERRRGGELHRIIAVEFQAPGRHTRWKNKPKSAAYAIRLTPLGREIELALRMFH